MVCNRELIRQFSKFYDRFKDMELVKHYIKTSKKLADPNINTASVSGHKWTHVCGWYYYSYPLPFSFELRLSNLWTM